ncbi:MAG: hypothetical protein HQM16_06070 [Deltaproteobacteria bacterium]|nr:hypothetical protein [Deltaproteobacteria bacterium]
MTDMIIKNLNSRFAEKISNTRPAVTPQGDFGGGVSKFDQVLSEKRDNKLLDKLSATIIDEQATGNKMEVFKADDIKINIQEGEFAQTTTFDGKDIVSNLFSTINNDTSKMDSIIEVLSASDTKLSRRQLLAYQASIGTLTINTDMFSKLAQTLSQNINTVLQTNMG